MKRLLFALSVALAVVLLAPTLYAAHGPPGEVPVGQFDVGMAPLSHQFALFPSADGETMRLLATMTFARTNLQSNGAERAATAAYTRSAAASTAARLSLEPTDISRIDSFVDSPATPEVVYRGNQVQTAVAF